MAHTADRKGERGSILVEFGLVFPMLMFLFLGVFDFGFYVYALIAVQDAARTAALYTSQAATQADAAGACQDVLAALQMLPNSGRAPSNCGALPIQLSGPTALTGPDGKPAVKVAVSYQTLPLFLIPGLPRQLTITRSVQMRVRP